jgi:hypothetical protein
MVALPRCQGWRFNPVEGFMRLFIWVYRATHGQFAVPNGTGEAGNSDIHLGGQMAGVEAVYHVWAGAGIAGNFEQVGVAAQNGKHDG